MINRRHLLSLGLTTAAGLACAGAARVGEPHLDPSLLFAGEWSDEVEGLRGRLVISRGKLLAEGKIRETVAYLELKYVPAAAQEYQSVYFDPDLSCELRDAADKPVPQRGRGGGGGGRPNPQWINLPYDSMIRLRLSPYGFGSEDGLRIIIGRNEWNIRDNDAQGYSLSGTFSSDPPQDALRKNVWRGTLKLVPMKVEARPRS